MFLLLWLDDILEFFFLCNFFISQIHWFLLLHLSNYDLPVFDFLELSLPHLDNLSFIKILLLSMNRFQSLERFLSHFLRITPNRSNLTFLGIPRQSDPMLLLLIFFWNSRLFLKLNISEVHQFLMVFLCVFFKRLLLFLLVSSFCEEFSYREYFAAVLVLVSS